MFDDVNKSGGPAGNTPGAGATIWPQGTEQAGNSGLAETNSAAGFGLTQDKRSVVEDILADAEAPSAAKPAVFQPKASSADYALEDEAVNASSHAIKKIFFLLVVLAVLGLAVILGYFGYKTFLADENGETTIPAAEESETAAEEEESQAVPDIEPSEETAIIETPAQPYDSDQDGLTDEEETALGLNINSVDSDNDGLFDREEVMVYKTNPLLPDTDYDGYLDGAEVKSGYNPNGSGRLYDLNQ
jgi:hypothetical protein